MLIVSHLAASRPEGRKDVLVARSNSRFELPNSQDLEDNRPMRRMALVASYTFELMSRRDWYCVNLNLTLDASNSAFHRRHHVTILKGLHEKEEKMRKG